MKRKLVKILGCSLIVIIFLTIRGSSSEYSELVLKVGDTYDFKITDLEALLEINGTDYMDAKLELLGMFGITNTSIKQGDTFEITLKSIQEQNETNFLSSTIGPVYEVNVSQKFGNETNELMTTTDMWMVHYFVLVLVTSLGFDVTTPESSDFSDPEPPSSSVESVGPPVFTGINLTFYEMFQNQSSDAYPTKNTTIVDNITSTWEIDTGVELNGDIFSFFYYYNGTKVLNSTTVIWNHVSIANMSITADISRNIVTTFYYLLFSSTTLDNATRKTKTVYGFEEPSDEPETPTVTSTTHPTTLTTSTPTVTPITTEPTTPPSTVTSITTEPTTPPSTITSTTTSITDQSTTIPSQETSYETGTTTNTLTIPEESTFLDMLTVLIIYGALVVFIRRYRKK
ncbi:MAG: hypothetical protein JSV04_11380 [Candidatus Heimdallarchaeota archaeon]|nr:MAG: hypothetical protein JSV04_11380 [Candidatus Heimdallarchaeota archaeon]